MYVKHPTLLSDEEVKRRNYYPVVSGMKTRHTLASSYYRPGPFVEGSGKPYFELHPVTFGGRNRCGV